MDFKVEGNALTPRLYCELRRKVNFPEYSEEDAALALARSLYTVVVWENETPAGIARIVGDGRIVFFIKDVVVDPAYQCKTVGKLLMDSLLSYIEREACPNAYVGLMATPGTEGFYEKFGFIRRPSQGYGPGMVKFVQTGGRPEET